MIKWNQHVWYIIILTLLLIIYFGQLYEFFRVGESLSYLSQWADYEATNFKDKWDQYLGFIPSMFIAPDVSFIDHTLRLGNIR